MRNKKYRDRGVRATTSVYHPPLHLSLLLVHHLEVDSTSSPSPSTLTSSSPSLSNLSITDNQRPNEQCQRLSRWAVNYTITITIIILVRLVHHLLLLQLFDQLLLRPHQRRSSHHLDDHQRWANTGVTNCKNSKPQFSWWEEQVWAALGRRRELEARNQEPEKRESLWMGTCEGACQHPCRRREPGKFSSQIHTQAAQKNYECGLAKID